jgi:hypothetical protein
VLSNAICPQEREHRQLRFNVTDRNFKTTREKRSRSLLLLILTISISLSPMTFEGSDGKRCNGTTTPIPDLNVDCGQENEIF